jgi:hypothetical protein
MIPVSSRDSLPFISRIECRKIVHESKSLMNSDLIRYLREMAQTCTRLARACPHLATSHGLEEIAHDLMAKAKELDENFPK